MRSIKYACFCFFVLLNAVKFLAESPEGISIDKYGAITVNGSPVCLFTVSDGAIQLTALQYVCSLFQLWAKKANLKHFPAIKINEIYYVLDTNRGDPFILLRFVKIEKIDKEQISTETFRTLEEWTQKHCRLSYLDWALEHAKDKLIYATMVMGKYTEKCSPIKFKNSQLICPFSNQPLTSFEQYESEIQKIYGETPKRDSFEQYDSEIQKIYGETPKRDSFGLLKILACLGLIAVFIVCLPCYFVKIAS
jgi:hypothetical protein